MVSHVDLNATPQDVERQEHAALAPGTLESVQVTPVQPVRPHRVVKDANLDALPDFLLKQIDELFAGLVWLNDEELKMNVVLCGGDRCEHRFESRPAIVKELYFIVGRDGERAKPPRQARHAVPGSIRLRRFCGTRRARSRNAELHL